MVSLKLVFLTLTLAAAVMAGPSGKGLSNQEHYKEGAHNTEYDHEAFLGKEEAQKFHDLTPEEAKRRLGIIVDKIDTDRDGRVSQHELATWINKVSKRYVKDDVERMWDYFDTDNDGFVNMDELLEQYGAVEDPNEIFDKSRGITYKMRMDRDRNKFRSADRNHDGKLNKEEFGGYLHPEAFPELHDMYIEEIMQDMDKNGDGYATLEEYIDDRWPKKDRTGEEPDWLKDDKEQFRTHRDKNNDGKLSKEELTRWLVPLDYDPTVAEARHLFLHADKDKDDMLSRNEIVNNVDLFVGSQATEWGNTLARHDEF